MSGVFGAIAQPLVMVVSRHINVRLCVRPKAVEFRVTMFWRRRVDATLSPVRQSKQFHASGMNGLLGGLVINAVDNVSDLETSRLCQRMVENHVISLLLRRQTTARGFVTLNCTASGASGLLLEIVRQVVATASSNANVHWATRRNLKPCSTLPTCQFQDSTASRMYSSVSPAEG